MANNVYSTIRFESGSIESEHEFLRVFSEIENKDERGLEYSDIYTFGPYTPDEGEERQAFMDMFVGPREARITEFMGTAVEITSAWIAPDVFFEELVEHMIQVDPYCVLSMVYEDEFYMFAGVWVTDNPGCDDTYGYAGYKQPPNYEDNLVCQREESGGWFREQLDVDGVDPGEYQDYVTDTVNAWRRDLTDIIPATGFNGTYDRTFGQLWPQDE